MSDQAKQTWRIELNTLGNGIVTLNGQDLARYVSGIDYHSRAGELCALTLHFVPRQVLILQDGAELHLVVGERTFRVIEDTQGDRDDGLFGERRRNGRDHQSL